MKMLRLVCGFCLLIESLLVISLPGVALAQDEEEPITANITLSTDFPTVEAIAGDSFEFVVELNYKGEEDRIFDLSATVPRSWEVYLTPQYEQKRISSIKFEGSYSGVTEEIKMVATTPYWLLPEPGKYKITLEAVSEEVRGSIDVTAVITAMYIIKILPETERYNTTATAGGDDAAEG